MKLTRIFHIAISKCQWQRDLCNCCLKIEDEKFKILWPSVQFKASIKTSAKLSVGLNFGRNRLF